MKFTVEHAQKVAAELYDEPPRRCSPTCKACDTLAADWKFRVSQVLAALKFLEDDE